MLTQCGGTLTPTVAYDLVVNDGTRRERPPNPLLANRVDQPGLGGLSWAPTRTERPGSTSIVRVVWHARGTAEHGHWRFVAVASPSQRRLAARGQRTGTDCTIKSSPPALGSTITIRTVEASSHAMPR
jgi:hypothetical protein